MYSAKIKSKVDVMFDNLREEVSVIVNKSSSADDVINSVTQIVSSELTTRSKSILSDMLFDLSDELLETEFFTDIARQNRFFEINLRHEILQRYQFAPSTNVNYQEASKTVQALKVGGTVLVLGSAVEIGVVMAQGLALSSLGPIPIDALIAVSLGAALIDYYAIEPAKNKKALARALDNYLITAKQQFLNWFDEVEKYFNMRVEEIKRTL